MSRARGVTLIECLVALVVSSVLTAAVYALLLAGSRLARGASSKLEVRHGVRAAAAVLRAELQGLSARAGDLVAMSDSALTIRALRGFGIVCTPPVGVTIVLDDSLLTLLRSPDPTKDSVLVFVAGDSRTIGDDRWMEAAVTAVRRGSCATGALGTALTLGGASAAADLAATATGAPVRLFEILEYRRYRDAAGLWWLGVRGPAAGGGWTATSPVAGPLRPAGGLAFGYLDTAQIVASSVSAVALVEVTLRGLAMRATAPGAVAQDSLTLRIAVTGP